MRTFSRTLFVPRWYRDVRATTPERLIITHRHNAQPLPCPKPDARRSPCYLTKQPSSEEVWSLEMWRNDVQYIPRILVMSGHFPWGANSNPQENKLTPTQVLPFSEFSHTSTPDTLPRMQDELAPRETSVWVRSHRPVCKSTQWKHSNSSSSIKGVLMVVDRISTSRPNFHGPWVKTIHQLLVLKHHNRPNRIITPAFRYHERSVQDST